jgi:hypothetical protein
MNNHLRGRARRVPASPSEHHLERLRNRLKPNRELRDWGQIGTYQRLISTFEVTVKSAEMASRWVGDPSNPLKRIAEEVVRLNEGWAKDEAEAITEFRRAVMS